MAVLRELADEFGVHERTLRRGLSDGLIRGRRPTPRSIELAPGESAYLRTHWSLLSALREALRTERGVRLAVLVGSVARGEALEGSDVDLLVRLEDEDWRVTGRMRERLARVAGRPVDLIALEAAEARPLLLHALLRDGRVLIDRDDQWPTLLARRSEAARRAARAARDLRREIHALVAELSGDP